MNRTALNSCINAQSAETRPLEIILTAGTQLFKVTSGQGVLGMPVGSGVLVQQVEGRHWASNLDDEGLLGALISPCSAHQRPCSLADSKRKGDLSGSPVSPPVRSFFEETGV